MLDFCNGAALLMPWRLLHNTANMHKALLGGALLTLIALPALAEEKKNVTYEFKRLSETERSADGTVGVVPITRSNEILATLVLTHKAVEEHEATLIVTPPSANTPATLVDKGVISFTFKAGPVAGHPGSFNYPPTTTDERKSADMDLEIEDGELSGSIQVEFSVG
jgi:hypothetical protein